MTTLSRLKNLELRIAVTTTEIDAAQALRYRVFYCEMGARGSLDTHLAERDVDRFDAFADHLVVVDLDRESHGRPTVVGCYRLLREAAAARAGGFYTAGEFDLGGLDPGGPILELGRSCIDPAYRSGTVMQLLWRGISEYLEQHDIALMLGCASLPGTDPEALALPLSYLHTHHLAPPPLRPRALPARHVATDRLDPASIDTGAAIRALPPLLKGYLRLGGMIGEGAVIDEAFNTVDVCLVLPTERVQTRYQRHYAQARATALVPA